MNPLKNKRIVIGLTGRKQSGKDTACSALAEAFLCPMRFAFGDPLKHEVAAACDVTIEYINAHKDLFRPMLQWWGTEFRRGQDPDYWVRILTSAIAQEIKYGVTIPFAPPGLYPIIVTDVRYPNEADMIKRFGGEVWRIVRPALANEDQHISEHAMDDYSADRLLVNGDGINAFAADVVEEYTIMLETLKFK